MLRINNLQVNHYEPAIQFYTEDDKRMDVPTKILVAEDDPISQRVAQLALENMGYQVDIAGIGSKALELYQVNNYGAFLMDMGLPDTSGIEVAQQIRELEQTRGTHTTIIALTAHIAAMAKKECLEAGMDDFSTKPLKIEPLSALLKDWIGKTNC
jgi:CheY-like chemotaxis protein